MTIKASGRTTLRVQGLAQSTAILRKRPSWVRVRLETCFLLFTLALGPRAKSSKSENDLTDLIAAWRSSYGLMLHTCMTAQLSTGRFVMQKALAAIHPLTGGPEGIPRAPKGNGILVCQVRNRFIPVAISTACAACNDVALRWGNLETLTTHVCKR